jgi:hypothetical protein
MSIGRIAAKANRNRALRILFSIKRLMLRYCLGEQKAECMKIVAQDGDGVLKPR